MTVDLPNIDKQLSDLDFYNISINDHIINCSCTIESLNINLFCDLSSTFPYELPSVFIDKASYNDIAPLPHVDPELCICTFDRTTCIPNFLSPIQIILDSFIQARTTIKEGITGQNASDFVEEIDAYWNIDCTNTAVCLVAADEDCRVVPLYYGKNCVYLADTRIELDNFISNVGIHKRIQTKYQDCLYLPLDDGLCPPFPNSNIELYRYFQNDSKIFEIYRHFMKGRVHKGAFILTSIRNRDGRSMQLWHHSPVRSMFPGFRKNKVPIGVAYTLDQSSTQLTKFYVMNASQKRLFSRGGDGLPNKPEKVAVIGCGSVGSYIVEALAEYGTSNFILNDYEKLLLENIARHSCGYDYIGKHKTSAVADKLRKSNPNIQVEVFDENGICFLDAHTDVLNSCDCIIIATAYLPLEHKAIELLNSSTITKPVILVWVEPHMAAGHAFIIQKPQNIFEEFFGSNFSFLYSVLQNPGDFSKKESGCQSTFIPYSAFSLRRFLYTFLDYLTQSIGAGSKQGNYLYTWCGDLTKIRSLGGVIGEKWRNAENFSVHTKRID